MARLSEVACIQSVEVGWDVDPNIYAHDYPLAPHLFIYATNLGYGNGCYNDVFPDCVGWTTFPGSPLVPGMTVTFGSPGGAPSELPIIVENDENNTGWIVFAGGYELGSYGDGGSVFTGTMQNYAQTFMVGGEVFDTSSEWVTRMGSGADPSTGYGQASYIHDFAAWTAGASNWNTSFGAPTVTQGDQTSASQIAYGYSTSAPAESGAGWTNYFYLGNAPQVFWIQNYRYDWSPIGDWAGGSYKGQCKVGQPVTGLSKPTSGLTAHALRCGDADFPYTGVGSSTFCNYRAFGPNANPPTNQGDTDNGVDWDGGYFKGECAANEYVSGFAQTGPAYTAPGPLDSIFVLPRLRNPFFLSMATLLFDQFDRLYESGLGQRISQGTVRARAVRGRRQ